MAFRHVVAEDLVCRFGYFAGKDVVDFWVPEPGFVATREELHGEVALGVEVLGVRSRHRG